MEREIIDEGRIQRRDYLHAHEVSAVHVIVAFLMYGFWLFPPLGLLVSIPCLRNGFRGFVGVHAANAARISIMAYGLIGLVVLCIASGHFRVGATVFAFFLGIPAAMLFVSFYMGGAIGACARRHPKFLSKPDENYTYAR